MISSEEEQVSGIFFFNTTFSYFAEAKFQASALKRSVAPFTTEPLSWVGALAYGQHSENTRSQWFSYQLIYKEEFPHLICRKEACLENQGCACLSSRGSSEKSGPTSWTTAPGTWFRNFVQRQRQVVTENSEALLKRTDFT